MEKITAKIIQTGSVPIININGENYSSLSFKSFRPTKRNLSDFHKAGLKIYNILVSGCKSMIGLAYSLFGEPWIDDDKYDFSKIDDQIDFFIKEAPDAYFGIMIDLNTREWWHNKRKNYPDSYNNFGKMMMDKEYVKYASKYLENAVKHIEEKYGDKVYGYYLLNARTTEWFSMNYEKPSQFVFDDVKEKKLPFSIPSDEQIEVNSNRILLNKDKDFDLIEYRKYLSNYKSNFILDLAKSVKNITERRKLVGLYYGYSTEMDVTGFINHGNIEFNKVFESDDVDIIISPISYKGRDLSMATMPMLTYSSITERNKIYYLEFDHVTHCAKLCPVPGFSDRAASLEDSIDYTYREFSHFIVNGNSYFWFDMFEGWYYDDKLMDVIKKQIDISKSLINNKMASVSEVAEIIDADSFYYLNKNNELFTGSLSNQRQPLALTGAPYNCYSSNDLEKCLDEKIKFVLFSNQVCINKEQSKIIEQLKKQEKTLCFVYAPGYIENGNASLENMNKTLSMNLAKQKFEDTICLTNGEEIHVCESAPYPYENYSACGDETFYIDDKDVIVLGYYKNNKKPAIGYKKVGNSTIIYVPYGPIPQSLLRKFYELSGVHCYTTNDDLIVNLNSDLISVYHRNKKAGTLSLKNDETYVDLYTNKIYKSENKILKIDYCGERTKLLLKQK